MRIKQTLRLADSQACKNMRVFTAYHLKLYFGLEPLRPLPTADKGSKSAAQNKECHEFVLRTSETTIFWAGSAFSFKHKTN
jgi:hypothetical protein